MKRGMELVRFQFVKLSQARRYPVLRERIERLVQPAHLVVKRGECSVGYMQETATSLSFPSPGFPSPDPKKQWNDPNKLVVGIKQESFVTSSMSPKPVELRRR